jgi:hypothetical protein
MPFTEMGCPTNSVLFIAPKKMATDGSARGEKGVNEECLMDKM